MRNNKKSKRFFIKFKNTITTINYTKYIKMHETIVKNVKGYIDYNDNFLSKGWCFHLEYGVLPLKIKDFDIKINIEERNDVQNFYKDKKDTKDIKDIKNIKQCGWEFNYKDSSDKKEFYIQMFINNEWVDIFRIVNNSYHNTKVNNNVPTFLVIDNVYEDPDFVREFALKQEFNYHPNYHKGRRTDKVFNFLEIKELIENKLNIKIKNWNEFGTNGCFQYCVSGDQLVYHYDSQDYAGVLFLTKDAPPQTGTTFYRSKYTKKMKVDNGEDSIVFKNGFLDPTEFDVVDVVGNVYNRLVIFDAKLIHAASCYFGNNINNGRLFQLFFFNL
jgi:hypothetical protein